MSKNVIINADDFGISLGVMHAIKKMVNEGRLNSVSIFANAEYTDQAIDFCARNPHISCGLHFNLTTGPSVSGHGILPSITDNGGNFKFGFVGLLWQIIKTRGAILLEIENELNAQLELLQELKIVHIDGHRHVHFIPGIFGIVRKVSATRNINRIRVINESVLRSAFATRNIRFLFDGGLVKLFILRLCGLFNGSRDIKAPYFFSILYTCKITRELTTSLTVPPGYDAMEIMIHPGDAIIDSTAKNILYEQAHLTSSYRNKEAEFSIKL